MFCFISWQSAVRAGYCGAVFTRPCLSHVVLLRGHTVLSTFRLVPCVSCFITPSRPHVKRCAPVCRVSQRSSATTLKSRFLECTDEVLYFISWTLPLCEHPQVGYEFTSNVDTGTSEWDIDEGHPLMEALDGLLEQDGLLPRHALVAALVGVHG